MMKWGFTIVINIPFVIDWGTKDFSNMQSVNRACLVICDCLLDSDTNA